jgi:protein gp37
VSTKSKIEWTEQTWNPVTGCTKISSGCKYCYAEVMAKRLQAMNVRGYENGFNLSILPERLAEPLNRKKPTIYFVNSMSDLFHEGIDDNYIEQVFAVIGQAKQHQFQILTKRAQRLASFFMDRKVPNNAWLGVSVENKEHGLARIEYLREIDAKIRFLSCEPLLENLGYINLKGIHWVIVGGESGANARPMAIEWAENIQYQCQKQGVKFFFKQWGGWGADGKKRPKKENGRILSGRVFNEMPINF